MALTFIKRHDWVSGDRRETVVDVTFDNSYPTGGEVVTPQNFGLTSLDYIDSNQAPGGKSVSWDQVNKKLLVFSGATEATNASDQSALTIRLHATGRS
jgi:hypothetical protein